MRILFKNNNLSRFVQRTLVFGIGVVFCVCIYFVGVTSVQAASEDVSIGSRFTSIVTEVLRQMDGVAAYTAQAIRAVFEEKDTEEILEVTPQSRVEQDRFPTASGRVPFSGSQTGTLIINAPLSLYDRLVVSKESNLATTSVRGLLRGDRATFEEVLAPSATFDELTVHGSSAADSFLGRTLSIREAAEMAVLTVMRDAFIRGMATVHTLTVEDLSTLNSLLVNGEATINGPLLSHGGILTNGADVNLGDGSLFASNVVYEVLAGEGVTITGASSSPTISVKSAGVISLNGETGELEIQEGTDIDIVDFRISNGSTLFSVRARGGCNGCLTDLDVSNSLTLTSGSIDGIVIGANETAAAFVSTLAISTSTATTTSFQVFGTGTSTFGGSINLESGCFSVNGVCIASASTTLYTGLTDTPSTLTVGALQYVDAAGTALTQSPNLVFDGSSFSIGTSSPRAMLTVDGSGAFAGAVTLSATTSLLDRSVLSFYDADNSNYVGLRASSTVSSNVVFTLPATDGAANEVLVTNGSGQLSFIDPASITGVIDTFIGLTDTPREYATGSIPYESSSVLSFSTDFVFDGSSFGVGTSSPSATLTIDGSSLFTGAIELQDTLSLRGQSDLRFYNTANSYYAALRAPSSLGGNIVWDLPISDGSVDEVLVTNGSGQLRFEPVSAVGGGVDTYLKLDDTPSSYIAGALQYASSSSAKLTQSNKFVFNGTSLGIGTNNPTSELTVYGSTYFGFDATTPGLVFNDASNAVSIGTTNTGALLNVEGGSIKQQGGRVGDEYEPQLVSSLNMPDSVYAIEVKGDRAFVATRFVGNDLSIVDISNVAAPRVIGAVPLPASANDVFVSGQYAYVVTDVSGDDFHIIDISNSAVASVVGSINLPSSAFGVSVYGHHAFVTTSNTGDDFHIIDVSDPTSPKLISSLDFNANGSSVAVSGGYAYVVTTAPNYFLAIDITDPKIPVIVSSSTLPADGTAVQVQGDVVFVGTNSVGDDFHIIDVSNPANPTTISSMGLSSGATGLSVAGSYAYVSTSGTGDDLHVIDISDRTNPVEVGSVDMSLSALDVVVVGRYLYAGSESAGDDFHIYDITGVETQSVLTHSLESGALSVRGDLTAGGMAFIGSGVRIGIDGIQTDGSLIVQGDRASYLSGNLAIGTTTASSTLTVGGDLTVHNGTAFFESIQSTDLLGGAVNLTTDANGNIIRDPSDIRLKENIETIDDALSSLLKLRGVRYEWKDKVRFGTQSEIGFIAQEVDPILPEVVRKGGDYWSINTRNILAVVVEAVKEIWAELQGTQDEVAELRSRVEDLEAQLEETKEGDVSLENEDVTGNVSQEPQTDSGADDTEEMSEAEEGGISSESEEDPEDTVETEPPTDSEADKSDIKETGSETKETPEEITGSDGVISDSTDEENFSGDDLQESEGGRSMHTTEDEKISEGDEI